MRPTIILIIATMPPSSRNERSKSSKRSPPKNTEASSSSDDEVVFVGTSPSRQTHQQEVIELDSSSSSSDSSQSSEYIDSSGRNNKAKKKPSGGNVKKRPCTFPGDSPQTISLSRERRLNKRKRDRSYDEVEEAVVRRKDPPELEVQSNEKLSKGKCSAVVDDDKDLSSNNLKSESRDMNKFDLPHVNAQ